MLIQLLIVYLIVLLFGVFFGMIINVKDWVIYGFLLVIWPISLIIGLIYGAGIVVLLLFSYLVKG